MKLDLFAEMQRFALLICKPSYQEGLTEDQIKREQYLSVINLYAMPIFLIMNLFVFWFNPGYPLQTLAIVTAVQVLIITIFLVSCRFSLRIYKHINAFILVLLGPALFTFSADNLLISMIIGLLVPGYTLIISQDHFLTIASFITQLISLIHLYIPAYKRKIYDSDFDQVNEFVDQHLNLVVLGQTFIVSMNIILYSVYKNYSSWLQEARMKSESALTLQEKFFFKFSHELKNPLTGLLGNLEMAYGENLDPRVRTLISNAKVCGELLLQLINNILDSGKMELGNLEMNYTPVKVNEILEKIWGICGEMIKNKGLYGQLTVYKKVPQVLLLDSIRFLQIMLNLVRNAVRFTNSGRISVTVNWIEGTEITNSTFEPIPYDDDEGLFEKEEVIGTLLRSSGRKEDDNKPAFVLDTKQRHIPEAVDSPTHAREAKKGILKIIVSDTGIGLDEESVKGIFKLFPDLINKQVRENLAVKGLSMWITHQICEKMNGEIRLYSKQGRGSTFIVCILTESPRVELPVNNLQLGADEVEFGSEERATNTKLRALVMDDNPYNTDVLKKYLEKSQVDVVGCTKNGLEALNLYQRELAEGRMIHIITMDLDMPLLDGKTACEKIRAYEAAHNRPPCTILIVSGNCFETEIKECLDPAGKIKANHFIRKPMYFLEFQRLMASIQTHHAQNFRGPFHPKKVLIVDDDLFNLQFLGRLLNMDKHEYFEARNGKEAVDIYRKNWKDIMVIFMDCEMIVMDGYTATREIRKLQDKNKLPKIKIYGVTGHTGLEHENKCKEAGMNQILSKPFRHDNVRKIVNECLHELE